MQRRGDDVVKGMQVTRSQQRLPVEEARVLLQFLQGLGHHAAQKHARVHLPVEAFAYGLAAGCQVQRRAHGTDRADQFVGCAFQLTGPAHERIAAQRDAHGHHRAGVLLFEAAQYPVNLCEVA